MATTDDSALFFKLRTILIACFFGFVFLLFFYHANKILDPDLGWHLRAGADSIAQGKIIDEEIYNHPIMGEKWINHEWLPDIAAFVIYDALGYIGLTLVFAAVFTLTLIGQYRSAMRKYERKKSISPLFLLVLGLQLLGLFAMLPQLGVRMQVLVFPFLLGLLILLDGFTETKNQRMLLWLVPLFWLWANLHGSFLIGLFVFGFWLGIKTTEAIVLAKWRPTWLEKKKTLDQKSIGFGFVIVLFAAGATLLTPHGVGLYHLLAEYTDSYYQAHIVEWMPAWQHPVSVLKLLFFALVIAMIAPRIMTIWQKSEVKRPLDLWQIALVLLFLLLALESKRHFPLLFLAAFPFVVSELSAFLQSIPRIQTNFARPINAFPILLMSIGALVILLAQIGVRTTLVNDPFRDPSICESYPCAAVDFLQNSQHAEERLFNDYGWGGYLLWMWQGKEIFIDGRQPQKTFGEGTFLQEQRAFLDQNQTAKKLEEYDIDVVLLKHNPQEEYTFFERHILKIAPQNPPAERGIITFLKAAPEWETVFVDETAIVFAKKPSEDLEL